MKHYKPPPALFLTEKKITNCNRSKHVDLVGDGFATHVANFERLRANITRAVATEEDHVARPLHADGAAVGLLDFGDFVLEHL